MSQVYPELTPALIDFIAAQRLFFVGTAPAGVGGHVNVSPKGLDSFRVLDPRTVAYVDFTGSGVETIAHLRDNGRITFMFCAFDGPPKILRLYGRGEVLLPGTTGIEPLLHLAPETPPLRSIVRVQLDRIADACGFAVPRYDFIAQRDQLVRWAERKGPEGLVRYRTEKNALSIDGLEGLAAGQPSATTEG